MYHIKAKKSTYCRLTTKICFTKPKNMIFITFQSYHIFKFTEKKSADLRVPLNRSAEKVKVLRTAQGLAENSQNQTKKFFKAPAKAGKLLSLFSIVLIAYFLQKSNRNNRSAEKSCRNADFLRKSLLIFSF